MQRTRTKLTGKQVAAVWFLLTIALSLGEVLATDLSASAQSQAQASGGSSASGGLDFSAGGSAGSSAGGSAGASTGSGSSPGLTSLPSNLQQFLQFGMHPVSSGMKYLAPNTYQGAQTDLSNGFYTLSNGLTSGVSGLVGGYQSLQNEFMSRLSDQLQAQQELMVRLYQVVADPERMCQQLASSAKSVAAQASSQAQQAQQAAGDTSNSFVRRFSFNPFG